MSLGITAAGWAAIGAIGGAGAGIYASDQAADASKRGLNQSTALQRDIYGTQLRMLEPSRQLGYGATSDLASLFGYNLSPYQTAGQLTGGGYGGGGGGGGYGSGPINVGGRSGEGNDLLAPLGGGFFDPLGFGDEQKKFGASINPMTGRVDVRGGRDTLDDEFSAWLQGTGPEPTGGGGKFGRIKKEIERLRGGGYEYDPNAATAAANFSPAAPGTPGNPGGITQGPGEGGAAGTTMWAGGQPPGPNNVENPSGGGNFGRFQASPDYSFRFLEGIKGGDQSASAQGQVLSGNRQRGAIDFSSNLASGEYGNYVNRLLSMAGLGQTATGQGVQAAGNYGANAGNNLVAAGDARASGVMGGVNSATNAINSGFNNYFASRYFS